MALNEDWERFAGFILEDNDIQRISMDNPLVYDKCFEMLNLWERMSENPVSKGMVKQKLIKLKRNDILSSLEESKYIINFFEETKGRIPHSCFSCYSEKSSRAVMLNIIYLIPIS